MKRVGSTIVPALAWIWVFAIVSAYLIQFRPILAQLLSTLWKG